MLVYTDNLIKIIFDGLKERGIEECVNTIIVSDHGMAPFGTKKFVELSEVQLTDQYFQSLLYISWNFDVEVTSVLPIIALVLARDSSIFSTSSPVNVYNFLVTCAL